MNADNKMANAPGSRILNEWMAERQANKTANIHNAGNGVTMVQSSDPRVLDLFSVSPAAAGVHVTPESAQRVSAVFACVGLISGGISTLPIRLYKGRKGNRREVEDEKIDSILNTEPCAAWTAASHWAKTLQYVLLRGDSFSLIKRTALGLPKEIIPLPWDAVVADRQSLSIDSRNMYSVNDGYNIRGYDQDDILHFPGYGFNGLRSMSVISWGAKQAAGNAIAMDEFSGRFFADGAHHSVILKTPKKMSDEQITSLQTAYTNKYSGLRNAHRIPLVLTEGMEPSDVGMSVKDSQLLDARNFQVRDIARAFQVPPHMIGDSTGNTAWGTGLESFGKAFVMYTLNTHLVRNEQEIKRKLFMGTGIHPEFDREALAQADLKALSDYYRAALGGPGTGKGWMTPNEVRERQYLPAMEGEDKLFTPEQKTKGSKE